MAALFCLFLVALVYFSKYLEQDERHRVGGNPPPKKKKNRHHPRLGGAKAGKFATNGPFGWACTAEPRMDGAHMLALWGVEGWWDE